MDAVQRNRSGTGFLVISALVAAAVSVWVYFDPGSGVSGTIGAGGVIVSSLLLAVAALFCGFAILPRWTRGLLNMLILALILGTGFAAWLLHSYVLLAAMLVALIAELVRLATPSAAVTAG